MYRYKGLFFSRNGLVIEVKRFNNNSIYYFVVVRYGFRGYHVLYSTRDLQKAFDFCDGCLIEDGDKG
mgnify:FL=1